jgi:cytochrome b561
MMIHNALLLAGMVVADVAILATWWFLGSRLVPAEQAPESANAETETGVRALHRVLTYVCFFLLAGLIIECVAMFPAILVRFGWS